MGAGSDVACGGDDRCGGAAAGSAGRDSVRRTQRRGATGHGCAEDPARAVVDGVHDGGAGAAIGSRVPDAAIVPVVGGGAAAMRMPLAAVGAGGGAFLFAVGGEV